MKAKLTLEQIAKIRVRWAKGESQRKLAAEYGVAQGHISRLVNGKSRTTGRTVPETLQRIYDRLR